MAVNQADPGQIRFGHCNFCIAALQNVEVHYATPAFPKLFSSGDHFY
jgi:hypothetical protein